MKTQIFTFVFNRPNFLQYQINSLKKFFIGDYDINVVYDSRDNRYYDEFEKICKDNKINFYNHLSEPGGFPSFYHAQSAKWAYDTIVSKKNDCIIMFLDHDIFLIDDLNISHEIENYDIIGCLQTRNHVKYIWPGLFVFKKSSIENIDFDFYSQIVEGESLDTGGGTYKLLLDKSIKFLDSGVEYPEKYKDIDLKDENITGGYGYELHFDGKFFHFRNACNWHNGYQVVDERKTDLAFKMLSDILDDNE